MFDESFKIRLSVIFANNFILNSGDDGIDVNYGFNISVYNNTIIKSSDKGISLSLDSLSILNLIHNNILISNIFMWCDNMGRWDAVRGMHELEIYHAHCFWWMPINLGVWDIYNNSSCK